MREIVTAQGGSSYFSSNKITNQLGEHTYTYTAPHNGFISEINSTYITAIAKILGAPKQKGSGIFLDKKLGEKVMKGDYLFTFYSETLYNLKEAKDSLSSFPIMKL